MLVGTHRSPHRHYMLSAGQRPTRLRSCTARPAVQAPPSPPAAHPLATPRPPRRDLEGGRPRSRPRGARAGGDRPAVPRHSDRRRPAGAPRPPQRRDREGAVDERGQHIEDLGERVLLSATPITVQVTWTSVQQPTTNTGPIPVETLGCDRPRSEAVASSSRRAPARGPITAPSSPSGAGPGPGSSHRTA